MLGRAPAQRLAQRYRREDGFYLIELRLRELRALFNSLDPAPFLDKDLDDEAERYIVGAAKPFLIENSVYRTIDVQKKNLNF